MIKTDLSRFDNSWYQSGAGSLKRFLWYFVNAWIFNSYLIPASGLKCSILRHFGSKVGRGVNIKPKVNIKYPWKLTIGNYVWIGEEVWIDNLDKVTIGDNSCISQGAFLLCGNHNYRSETFELLTKEIFLEEGVWIGAKSTVCPGVRCKSHSVLVVNSVATSDLEAYTIYQGNPAVFKKLRGLG